MHIITVDFETHYSTDYSLSKLSPLEYVRDARFQIISASIRYPNGQCTTCFGEHDVRQALAQVDWGCSAFLAHNGSGFDAYVAAYHFGINPRLWMCTLAMARPIFAKTVGLSLGKLVEHFGIGVKDNTALVQTRGKRLEDFTAAERAAMAAYNQADTEQCWALFGKLRPYYNIAELWQIDTMVRMRTEPQFVVDQAMLEVALSIERGNKQKDILHLAKLLGATREGSTEDIEERVRQHLASAPKFSALLQQLGEPVPMKPSPTNPDKQVPALAKTDQAFTDLLESSNPVVAAAARARLAVKSTLLETRIGKFLTAARLADGRLPVPLRYCGADTTGRPSGEEYNCLNLPRVSPDKPKVTDALRNSLMAPPGKAVMVADSSGIEMRVNHFLWQVPYSTALWTADPEADLYRASAAIKYNIRPEDVSKAQRQGAKVELLALGYGMGAAKYVDTARLMGGITLSPEQAQTDVYDWRNRHGPIVAGWKMLDKALTWIARGKRVALDPGGLIHTHPEGLLLPSGRLIRYPDLRQETDEATGKAQWAYAHGRHKAYLYGGKSVENLCQALARDIMSDYMLQFYRQTGLRPCLYVYDELVYVVDQDQAPQLLNTLQTIMRTPPKWWPQLRTWSEGDIAQRYGHAK